MRQNQMRPRWIETSYVDIQEDQRYTESVGLNAQLEATREMARDARERLAKCEKGHNARIQELEKAYERIAELEGFVKRMPYHWPISNK
jgi:hypothetical protein